MKTKQGLSRASERPSRRIYGTSQFGKCHLIKHTRKPSEERPICLSCPYEQCLLDHQPESTPWTNRTQTR